MEPFEENLLKKWLDKWQQFAGEIEMDILIGLRSGLLSNELYAIQQAATTLQSTIATTKKKLENETGQGS